jgi:hypothetical protein
LGLDVQLKILQALPSLLQNYGTELEGNLLGKALQLCASLQAAKASTVSGVAAATLQQLVTTVFEKVANEDRDGNDQLPTTNVPGNEAPVPLKPAAFDAYRIFRDLVLAADERDTKFVSFSALPPNSSLELIWSSIDSNPDLFQRHEELLSIIGANVLPLVVRALSERLAFPVTVRSIRLLDLIMHRYMLQLPGDCEVALELCIQALEPEFAPSWKRALVLEMLRNFFASSSHVVDAYSIFDSREGGKSIVQDLLSAFVRLSTEKPVAIGLGQQSTVPTGPTYSGQNVTDQATLEAAGGMAGVISSAFGVTEASVAGVSLQWSIPKTPCMEQLDKHDAPPIPETYAYALVLECLGGLAENLARIVLPLTVQNERNRTKRAASESEKDGELKRRRRSSSFRARAVPINPLEAKDAPYATKVMAVAGIVDRCWPAVLATSGAFLNAALDDQYFRNLIKSYQRFAQVAGLLRLSTPRDALMTTLAKSAVPPHVLNAAVSEPAKTPSTETARAFPGPKSILNHEGISSQPSSTSIDASRRTSTDSLKPMLTVRNLLCLRALLNLAIALGPTLGPAFVVVISALKQADIVLSTTTPQQITRQGSFSTQSGTEHPSIVQAFSNEVAAVEAAASRLLESTSDYPNDAFANVLDTFCKLLHGKIEGFSTDADQKSSSPRRPGTRSRTLSGLPGVSVVTEMHGRDYQFVIPKLGNLAELNVTRFNGDEPEVSGWTRLTGELIDLAKSNDVPRDARKYATDVLVKLSEATIADAIVEEADDRAVVQRRALDMLYTLIRELYHSEGDMTSSDLLVQGQVLEAITAVLERCGDSLVAGWNRVVAIISSAFEHEHGLLRGGDDDATTIDWSHISAEFVSPQIGRTAFAATQLLCSDFLDSLSVDVVPVLIELLHRFMCQKGDLNAALTTVTMAWNVSDNLFAKFSIDELHEFVEQATEFDELDSEMKPMLRKSRPAQWLQALIRLRDVACQSSTDVRNAAYQTLCNVFKNHGEQLPPAAWNLSLRSTLLHIARSDSYSYLQDVGEDGKTDPSLPAPDMTMSKTIINGNSSIITQHLRLIEQVAKLPSLWELFLSMLERYLDVEAHILNEAVYSSLAMVLQAIEPSSTLWKGPIYRTTHLWLKRVPDAPSDVPGRKTTNQAAFLAYAQAGGELYRLTRDGLSTSQARTMIDNLYHCVRSSDGPLYGADANTTSPLQASIMSIFRSMRLDQPDVPACLVTVGAKLATLPCDLRSEPSTVAKQSPTFVAIASDAIAWIQELVVPHIGDTTLAESGALAHAIRALRRLIESKYAFSTEHKGVPLWRKASLTGLALAQIVIDQTERHRADRGLCEELWSEYVGIACGIVSAHHMHLVPDREKIYRDQKFDMQNFAVLRKILIPRLGDPLLPDALRNTYVQSLFEASIIHEPEAGEMPLAETSPLRDITKVRRGRVKNVPYSPREEMAYTCWKEMLDLSSAKGGSPEDKKLAQAAAPHLILRLALPVRTYIADQPLRGRRPQPLSELDELLFCLDSLETLTLEPDAMTGQTAGRGVAGGVHLRYLYPLLVQAVHAAGDRWSGSEEVLLPLQKTLAAIHDL